ncbi:VOC family protein [Photobacterium halotolerans]|uniref:VOC family protein n=1 Tax=Photobacterium halotolerans TaxID=265726 RepID=UPI00041AD276|nr:VOC family protein [Photobacterium halotolerans]NAW87149.1 hypothetical protein [Photobacterium halotolerans]NAX46300.1 hypothetical protein [Photobacterium halotolerans]
MTNPFVFHEIVTPAPFDLSHFYGEVFGWQFQRIDDQGTLYAIRSPTPGCAPVGLLTKTSDEPGFSQNTLFYIQVEDIDAFLPKAVSFGAQIVMPATASSLGEWQYRLAVLCDPQGNHFGVMEPVTRAGQVVPLPGTPFDFNEIVTAHPTELVARFYQPLFDWTIEQTGSSEAPFYTISTGRNATLSGGIAKVSEQPGFNSYAGFYIRVDDIALSLEKIGLMGGEVIMPEVTVPLGDERVSIAMFTDPQRNQLGLIRRIQGAKP